MFKNMEFKLVFFPPIWVEKVFDQFLSFLSAAMHLKYHLLIHLPFSLKRSCIVFQITKQMRL